LTHPIFYFLQRVISEVPRPISTKLPLCQEVSVIWETASEIWGPSPWNLGLKNMKNWKPILDNSPIWRQLPSKWNKISSIGKVLSGDITCVLWSTKEKVADCSFDTHYMNFSNDRISGQRGSAPSNFNIARGDDILLTSRLGHTCDLRREWCPKGGRAWRGNVMGEYPHKLYIARN